MERFHIYKAQSEPILSLSEEQLRLSKAFSSPYFRKHDERLPGELLQTFGPMDIAIPFPLHLSLIIEEKRVTHSEVEIGWLHQGIEKAFETVDYQTGVLFVTRVNPRVSAPLALTYVLALEQLVGIHNDVPLLAQTWRVAMLEVSRVLHHLELIHKIVTLSAPLALLQLAEESLTLADKLYADVNHNEAKQAQWSIGGITHAPTREKLESLKAQTTQLAKLSRRLHKEILAEEEFSRRMVGLAPIGKETALSFALTGATLRACGVMDDIRRSHAYFDYTNFPPPVHTQQSGDAFGRTMQRLEETLSSLETLEKIIATLLTSTALESAHLAIDTSHINFDNMPVGSSTAFIEAPEGELAITVVSSGGPSPSRVRIRTPSFAQTAALPAFLRNADIDDVVLIILSLGIVGLEVDR